MIVTCSMHSWQRLWACVVFLRSSVPKLHMLVPDSLPLPMQESNYGELLIATVAHLFWINLNIHCCYVIKIIEMVR
jgi:hypothetical protein